MARRQGDKKTATGSTGATDDVTEGTADGETIDAVLSGLEAVVRELEGGDLPLEDALSRFERGVALARRGGAMLARVEERVEMLLADRDETVPFREETEEDGT